MKLKRYHIDVYCPEWSRNSILDFIKSLENTELTYSYHAKNKLDRMNNRYKRAVRSLISNLDIDNELYLDYIFEFYTNDNKEVRRACYRFPMANLDSDIILVIAHTGKIITIYLNNNFDWHFKLNEKLYEKGDINEGQIITES